MIKLNELPSEIWNKFRIFKESKNFLFDKKYNQPTKKQLKQAIIDCNLWLEYGEGVHLLYYYDDFKTSHKESYLIINNILYGKARRKVLKKSGKID
jgi:hypothetical protein